MKFFIDAHLSYSLAYRFKEKGLEVSHTEDLPARKQFIQS